MGWDGTASVAAAALTRFSVFACLWRRRYGMVTDDGWMVDGSVRWVGAMGAAQLPFFLIYFFSICRYCLCYPCVWI
ncbi:hypothetical protein IWX46DRAFT_381605 [Phyllosticta citricarpa]|uniref:Secreted peptide n=1 Tax=Phyllosticta citricarpa TaxID=55181 RepID=A0ABR1MMV5_9PEZI